MLSYAAVRGQEQLGGSALPATPGSAHHPTSCSVAPGLSPLATPTQPKQRTFSSGVHVSHRLWTCCLHVSRSILGWDMTPPQGAAFCKPNCPGPRRVQWQAGHIYPKVLFLTTQTPALPVVPAAPSISRAHWGLPAPLCRVWHHRLSSSSQSRDRPCWLPCRRNRLVLHHARPCHAMASSRAGQSWRGAGIANGIPGSRSR